MSDEEEDYMSDAFLNVKPGVSMVRRVKEAIKKEAKQKEKNIQNRQKTFKEQETESREAALQTSISNQNKGFALLQKMGYKAGQGLGKEGKMFVFFVIQTTERGQVCGRFQVMFAATYETKGFAVCVRNYLFLHFRTRVRTEREERKIEADLRRSQRSCEQLDSQKGVSVPREAWYWPGVDADNEDDAAEEEEEEVTELTSFDKLQILTSYLRGIHFYCLWCGTAYNDEDDLCSNCPGDTAADHE
uniref:G patch domain-containing protein 11 n=1 Tax=Kryptolebias marmoratus TaxID=37003 RepID=A0A3Q3FCW2_KRYMA